MGSVGRQRKSCCKRLFRPHGNRSLTHKKTPKHLGAELPNLEKSRSVCNYSITLVSYQRAPSRAIFNDVCQVFFSEDTNSHQTTCFKSLKILFCISDFSFPSLKRNGPTPPSWRVPRAAEAAVCNASRSSHQHQAAHRTGASEHLPVGEAARA